MIQINRDKRNRVIWTPELDAFIVNAHFVEKRSLENIHVELKVSANIISKRLKELGYIPINYQNQHSYTYESVINYINSGLNLTEIAKIYNISGTQITRLLKKHNFTLPNNFNENVFDVIDTEEKAYWLGFVYADGNISKEGDKHRYFFEISLKESDYNHLMKFNKFVEFKGNNIKRKTIKSNGKEYIAYRWMIGNKHLWKTLISHGCVPQKSLILKFPDESIFADKSLIRHFIRGYFDGDGCISRIIRKTVVVPDVSVLGTLEFITKLVKITNIPQKLIKAKHHKHNTFCLRCNAINDIVYFLNYMYKDATIYLDRKYKLYEFFKNGSRSIQEWIEFNESKTVNVCDDNAVVNVETKESTSPYSVEIEPANAE